MTYQAVSKVMGHKTTRTTESYYGRIRDMDAIQEIERVFGIVTVSTMLAIVMAGFYGFSFLPLKKVEKFTHAIAGGTIALSGMAIVFLGL